MSGRLSQTDVSVTFRLTWTGWQLHERRAALSFTQEASVWMATGAVCSSYCAASFIFSLPEIDTNSSQFINVTSSHSLISFTSRPSLHSILPRGPREFHVSGWILSRRVFLTFHPHWEHNGSDPTGVWGLCRGGMRRVREKDVRHSTFHLEFGCREVHMVLQSIVLVDLLIPVFNRGRMLLQNLDQIWFFTARQTRHFIYKVHFSFQSFFFFFTDFLVKSCCPFSAVL